MGLPGLPAPINQLINGNPYQWSSIEVNIFGQPWANATAVEYEESLEPGVLRGTSAIKKARTRGEYDASGKLTLYKGDLGSLLGQLVAAGAGKGYMEVAFDVIASYSEDGTTVTDVLVGCRIKSISEAYSNGNDALMVDLDLDVMKITRDGIEAVNGAGTGAGIGAAVGGAIGGLIP
jgi:hypothetical protein